MVFNPSYVPEHLPSNLKRNSYRYYDIGCKQNLVKVYDSWRTGDVTTDTKEAIANLLHTVIKEYIFFPEVQQQKDGSSCGVYALVYVHTLAEGNDPSGFDFPDEAVLRGYLF